MMPWAQPTPPLTMLGVVLGRAASLAAAECLFRGTLLSLLAGSIRDGVVQVGLGQGPSTAAFGSM